MRRNRMRRALLPGRRRHVRSADDVADAAADLLPYGISLWGPRASAIFGAAAVSDVDAHRGAFARAVDSPSSRPINSAASRSNEKSVAVSDVDAHCGAHGCPRARADADANGDTFVKPFRRPGACADASAVFGSIVEAVRTAFPTTYAGLLRVALPHRAFFRFRQRLGRRDLRDQISR